MPHLLALLQSTPSPRVSPMIESDQLRGSTHCTCGSRVRLYTAQCKLTAADLLLYQRLPRVRLVLGWSAAAGWSAFDWAGESRADPNRAPVRPIRWQPPSTLYPFYSQSHALIPGKCIGSVRIKPSL